MKRTISRLARRFVLCMLLNAGAAFAQVVAVAPSNNGLFASSDPTMTYLFPAEGAKATLVFIPGGEGRVGLKSDWTADHRYFKYHFNVALRSLADPAVSSGRFNVVIFDSPVDLPTANHWSAARTSEEHLSRVGDVVRHFAEKLSKPVWLMGHSMGSISITEFYKRLQESKSGSLVAGLILSGGENGTSFNYESTRLPVLVVHHENDECPGNTAGHAKKVYSKLVEGGNTASELILIRGGTLTPGNNNPCRSGYHMYFGAADELTKTLDLFMHKYLPKS